MSDPTHPAGEPTSAPAPTSAEPVTSAPPATATTSPAAPEAPAAAAPAPASWEAPAPGASATAMTATPAASPPAPAPAAAAPIQAPPTLMAPVSVPTPPAPVIKRSKAAPIFAILMVLALLGGGTAGALYYLNKRATDKTISEQKAQIADANAAAKKSADDLAKAQSDLAKAKTDLDAANKEVTRSAVCVQAGKDLTAAALKQDSDGTTRALGAIFTACGGIPSPN